MKKVIKVAGIILGIVIGLIVIGPFLIPVPPLRDVVPPEQLADADSRFVEVEGINLHYKEAGSGPTTLLLLHGFGASTFSWREVMPSLTEDHRVIAFDRPAFGLTERPMRGEWDGLNPYSPTTQPTLTVGLMDSLDVAQAVLVGNSAGGTVSVMTALEHPEHVRALILVDAAIYTNDSRRSVLLRWAFQTPQMRHIGPLITRRIRDWGIDFGRSAWHDEAKIPPDFWDGYTRPLQVENWDRALWELTRASEPLDLPARFAELSLPILVITGDDDRIVPTADSVRLAGELPNADLVVIPECGHIPQEECPEAWLEVVNAFLTQLGEE